MKICRILSLFCLLSAGIGICKAAGLEEMEKSVVMIRSAGQEFDFVTPWKQKNMSQG